MESAVAATNWPGDNVGDTHENVTLHEEWDADIAGFIKAVQINVYRHLLRTAQCFIFNKLLLNF